MKLLWTEQRNLGLFTAQEDHDYSTVPTRNYKQGGRPPFLDRKECKQMEVKSNVVSKKCSFWATPKMDLFLSRVSNQVSAYFFCKLDLFSKDRDAFQVS